MNERHDFYDFPALVFRVLLVIIVIVGLLGLADNWLHFGFKEFLER